MDENINKLKLIVNQILINIEIESRSISLEAYSDEKIKKIHNLLRFHGLVNFNTEKIKRYLVNLFFLILNNHFPYETFFLKELMLNNLEKEYKPKYLHYQKIH